MAALATMLSISSQLDDLALVEAAQQGDRSAMDQLLRRHYDRIYAVCRRVTGHDADAADATQEAMIALVRGLAKFDGRSSFSTWSYRIATNASLDELRRRRRRPQLEGRVIETNPGASIAERPDPHAGVHLNAVGDRLLLDQALADLPEDFRLPVVLRDVADLDYSAIAEVLEIPVGTVKSRIARGRSALAATLGRQFGNQTDTIERQTPAS